MAEDLGRIEIEVVADERSFEQAGQDASRRVAERVTSESSAAAERTRAAAERIERPAAPEAPTAPAAPAAPRAEAPTPEVTIPPIEVPVPEVTIPTIEVPTVEVPPVEVPTPEVTVEVPPVEVPTPEVTVEVPPVEVPTPEVTVEVPPVEVPPVSVTVEAPPVEVPAPVPTPAAPTAPPAPPAPPSPPAGPDRDTTSAISGIGDLISSKIGEVGLNLIGLIGGGRARAAAALAIGGQAVQTGGQAAQVTATSAQTAASGLMLRSNTMLRIGILRLRIAINRLRRFFEARLGIAGAARGALPGGRGPLLLPGRTASGAAVGGAGGSAAGAAAGGAGAVAIVAGVAASVLVLAGAAALAVKGLNAFTNSALKKAGELAMFSGGIAAATAAETAADVRRKLKQAQELDTILSGTVRRETERKDEAARAGTAWQKAIAPVVEDWQEFRTKATGFWADMLESPGFSDPGSAFHWYEGVTGVKNIIRSTHPALGLLVDIFTSSEEGNRLSEEQLRAAEDLKQDRQMHRQNAEMMLPFQWMTAKPELGKATVTPEGERKPGGAGWRMSPG
jgi:hypothetical protein